MRLMLLTAALLLSGCASQIMQGYVGKSVQEIELDYGPPVNIMELEDGKRAYQWRRTKSSYTPGYTYTTHTGAISNSFTTPGFIDSDECFYTMYAEQRGTKWIVTSFKAPSLSCE